VVFEPWRLPMNLCVHRVSVVKEIGWEPQRHDERRDRGSGIEIAELGGPWILSQREGKGEGERRRNAETSPVTRTGWRMFVPQEGNR